MRNEGEEEENTKEVGLEEAVNEQASFGYKGQFSVLRAKIIGKINKNQELGLKPGINLNLEKE